MDNSRSHSNDVTNQANLNDTPDIASGEVHYATQPDLARRQFIHSLSKLITASFGVAALFHASTIEATGKNSRRLTKEEIELFLRSRLGPSDSLSSAAEELAFKQSAASPIQACACDCITTGCSCSCSCTCPCTCDGATCSCNCGCGCSCNCGCQCACECDNCNCICTPSAPLATNDATATTNAYATTRDPSM